MPIKAPAEELRALEPKFSAYGLGFSLRDYRGQKLFQHNGLVPGEASRVVLVPELQLGIVILSNQESSPAVNAFTLRSIKNQFPISLFSSL